MKVWIIVDGYGSVIGAGTDPQELKHKTEKSARVNALAYRWKEHYGRERLLWQSSATGRWNSIPARYLDSADVDVDGCSYDCGRCNPDDWTDQEDDR